MQSTAAPSMSRRGVGSVRGLDAAVLGLLLGILGVLVPAAMSPAEAGGLSPRDEATFASASAPPPGPTSVTVNGRTHRLDASNAYRKTDLLVRYTPAWGATTRTNEFGTEVAVVGGRVTKVETGVGSMAIPAHGYVLSGHGTSKAWLTRNAKVGRPVALSTSVPTQTPAPSGPTVRVGTASQLTSALSTAVPGQTIQLADGVYRGNFTLKRSGNASAPIRVTGSRGAVLDGGTTSDGYVLHLDGVSYAQVDGISVTNGQKAVVLDQSTHVTLTDLDVHGTGSEAVLLRNYSRDNMVSNSEIHDTGLVTPGYGEGVYIGLSESNWSSAGQSRTQGGPDTSDRNSVVGNHIYATGAENVDVKEGTTGGLIAQNRFDGTGLSGANYADSWVDIAGNDYVIQDNTGVNAGSVMIDGYQTHTILSGWAARNVFHRNVSAVNGKGYGINVDAPASHNVVYSDNSVSGARRGLSNIPVSQ